MHSAKRYERLLKAHGAPASGRANAQPQGGLATPNSSSKRPSKKRKAPATANSDDDEDVKPNVAEAKAKTEDAEDDGVQVKTETKPDVKVKQEQPIALSDGSYMINAIPGVSSSGERGGGDGNGDDDLCLLCTTEQTNGYEPVVQNGGPPGSANHPIAGFHSFDYAANMNFHPQTMITRSEGPEPNHFSNSAWLPRPEPHQFYWGMVQHWSSENGHQA